MGILSRISKVLEANVSSLLDKAEDPAKMLDQAIEDMKKGRAEARQAIIEAKTSKKLLEKKRDKALADSAELERKAMLALRADDEDLARKLLEAKMDADRKVELEGTAADEQDEQVKQLQIAERELERRLTEMPAKRAALLARQSAAQAKGARVGASTKAQDSVSSALEAFERMEEKITRAEVEAEVLMESNPKLIDTSSLDRLATEDALAALKARVSKGELPPGPSTKKKAADAVRDPVEDSLREMKKKLNREE